jgi:hypothetical protein
MRRRGAIVITITGESTITDGFDPNVKWEPFIDGMLVGYKATRLSDGLETFIYFNPSTSGEGQPDLFVYSGSFCDPENDMTECYLTPYFPRHPKD